MQVSNNIATQLGSLGDSYTSGVQAGQQQRINESGLALQQVQIDAAKNQQKYDKVAQTLKLLEPGAINAAKNGGQKGIDDYTSSVLKNPEVVGMFKGLGIDPNNIRFQVADGEIKSTDITTKKVLDKPTEVDVNGDMVVFEPGAYDVSTQIQNGTPKIKSMTLDKDYEKTQSEVLKNKGQAAKDFAEAAGAGKGPKQDTFGQEEKLRTEVNNLTKDYTVVKKYYSTLQKASTGKSGVSDLSIIFSYMKMIDPRSTVREGEQASATNAGGITDKIMNIYNKVAAGAKLGKQQRKDFIEEGGKIFQSEKEDKDKVESHYKGIAEDYGLNIKHILRENDEMKNIPLTENSASTQSTSKPSTPHSKSKMVIQDVQQTGPNKFKYTGQ